MHKHKYVRIEGRVYREVDDMSLKDLLNRWLKEKGNLDRFLKGYAEDVIILKKMKALLDTAVRTTEERKLAEIMEEIVGLDKKRFNTSGTLFSSGMDYVISRYLK